jgi:hypothetical protein
VTRPAEVRFYIDADILGLAHVLAALRPDTTYPGDPGTVIHKRSRPPCPIASPGALDPIWLPIVAEREWLVITRDGNIAQHRAEIDAVKEHGVKLVAISGKEGKGTFGQLEIVMSQWRDLEALASLRGPFAYVMTRTTLRSLNL